MIRGCIVGNLSTAGWFTLREPPGRNETVRFHVACTAGNSDVSGLLAGYPGWGRFLEWWGWMKLLMPRIFCMMFFSWNFCDGVTRTVFSGVCEALRWKASNIYIRGAGVRIRAVKEQVLWSIVKSQMVFIETCFCSNSKSGKVYGTMIIINEVQYMAQNYWCQKCWLENVGVLIKNCYPKMGHQLGISTFMVFSIEFRRS